MDFVRFVFFLFEFDGDEKEKKHDQTRANVFGCFPNENERRSL